MPGLPVHHQLPESTKTHGNWVSDAIQPFHPLSSPSPPSIFPSIRVFWNELALCNRWPKYFIISPSNEYSGLISFRMDWLDLLAVQGTLKSLLQHHGSKALILQCSGPIMSWQIDGETVTDFIFQGSKITADGDCSHAIKRHLLLGRKVMTNLDSILKGRDISLPTKVCLVKALVFPVVVYGCECWTKRKLSTEELMLLNCGVGKDSWEFLGLQEDPTSPSWRKSVLAVHWKD